MKEVAIYIAIIAAVTVSFVGVIAVSEPIEASAPTDYERAPRDYSCTVEQMARVERESKFCDANTSFFSSYCYGTAIMRNCTKRGQP